MANLENFLEFNGRRLSVLSKDGEWWIAVKPICEAISVDFNAQHRRVKSYPILSGVSSNQTIHDASNRLQEMFCISEKYVYGWLFSIQSEKPELLEFKRRCYEILYNHFHGALTDRITVLSERDSIDLRILELEEKLQETDEYKEILELKKRKSRTSKDLRRLDVELKTSQLTFSFS